MSTIDELPESRVESVRERLEPHREQLEILADMDVKLSARAERALQFLEETDPQEGESS